MFVGHMGAAVAAKVIEPRAPLGVLVAASFGLDLIWPLFLFLGLESVSVEPEATAFTGLSFDSYPWTHSLAMAVVWGVLAGLAARWLLGSVRIGVVVAAVVVSHWVLDFVTHRPDLPLWPGGPEVGLGLWHSIPATFVVEGAFFAAALLVYVRTFPPKDGLGRTGLAALVGLLTLIWVAGPFSPPPPDWTVVAWMGLALWILPFWAWRIEAHRMERPARPPG